MEQRDNQRFDGAPQNHASEGPALAIEQPRDQSQGQSSANDAGLRQADTMTQQGRAPGDSTSAQRAGGQSQGGQGMGNKSFEGSSLGGQAGSGASSALFSGDQPNERIEDYIEPAAGQANEDPGRESQGTDGLTMKSREAERDPAKSPLLDGE